MPESLIFVLSSLNSMLSNVLNSQRGRTRIIGCFLKFFFLFFVRERLIANIRVIDRDTSEYRCYPAEP